MSKSLVPIFLETGRKLQTLLWGHRFPQELNDMLEFALGLSGTRGPKRLRPSMLIFLARAYGVEKSCLNAALSIELFHSFTLVHDDIADKDEIRRNEPTLWKKWGVEKALNAGDMIAFLAAECMANEDSKDVRKVLSDAFIEVCEGQHMDFELSQKALNSVSEATYMEMTEKKTAALIQAAVLIPGIVAKKSKKERQKLRTLGLQLGIAYQMADDYRSIWSSRSDTGKDAQSDIREKKRTLPILIAYKLLLPKNRIRLERLYASSKPLTRKEVKEVLALINATDAKKEMEEKIAGARNLSIKAAQALSMSSIKRTELVTLSEKMVAI